MAFRKSPLVAFEKSLGYRFRKRPLLEQALTHRSYANELGLEGNYERLEFLGDAVLGLVTTEWLYALHPDLAEGKLSELKSHLVSRQVLAQWAEIIGVGDELRLGVGEDRSGGRTKDSLLADSMEAILGAVFLDRGIKAARKVIVPMIEEAMSRRAEGGYADAKTQLQERVQAMGADLPDYRHVAAEGPDHRKVFTVELWLKGELASSAQGPSKKIAERRAAATALERL